ncbi:hypothetical protein QK292_16960 [Arthrobacter sp. AL08]|nr:MULTISPECIES: hypothetical protein [unclassified Arthrobacter]MDI3243219.1 hypothetical protein [Arthrobacter sp. AL05]MDI3279250.1 hypothetical protein [Arthrobacter sp. AL08]WGZ80843.1 hypothetical protein QI450_06580 [Arthrobacter sp. EM1]
MQRTKSGLAWLTRAQPRALLQDLASGRLALTHEAFQQLPNWRTAAYLRDILLECGVLPAVDRQLLLFERWLTGHLAAVATPNTPGCSTASPPGTNSANSGPKPAKDRWATLRHTRPGSS